MLETRWQVPVLDAPAVHVCELGLSITALHFDILQLLMAEVAMLQLALSYRAHPFTIDDLGPSAH